MDITIIVGWISSIFLSLCAVPQAIQSFKNKNSDGINALFIVIWSFGEVLGLYYVIYLNNPILIFNYVINTICCICIAYYKFKPIEYVQVKSNRKIGN